MRKGARKRSASQRADESQPDGLTEVTAEVTVGGSRMKRVRASNRISAEPEFFEDKRNLEDLWMAAFPVGTELHLLGNFYQIKLIFTNLEEAFEESGNLFGKRVASPFPPSDKIGITSVQRESEEIIPMKQLKMDWVPYIPFEDNYILMIYNITLSKFLCSLVLMFVVFVCRGRQVDRLKSEIFTMSCTQRRAALKHVKIDRIKKYEYCLPYFKDPLKEDEDEQSTDVTVLLPAEPESDYMGQMIKDGEFQRSGDQS